MNAKVWKLAASSGAVAVRREEFGMNGRRTGAVVKTWLIERARANNTLLLVVLDSFAWITAMYVAAAFRLETWSSSNVTHISDAGGTIPFLGVLALGATAATLHCLLAWVVRLHQGRSATGSFEELFVLASVMLAVGIAVAAFNALAQAAYLPRTTAIAATCLALILVAWPRALWRTLVNDARPNRLDIVTKPVLIVGAGEAALQLVESMQRDPQQVWNPVGMVDDDNRKRHFRYRGVQVLGTIDKLAAAASKLGAKTIVIAVPSANSEFMSRVNNLARGANLDVKVLPTVGELLDGVDHSAVRNISPEDLLGRHQVETDIHAISGYLQGKRVLVTGAGGSIGSELCRQIIRFAPAELMMLDRDESALHSLVLSMSGRADLESPNVILANIRDIERLHEVFDTRRPQVVFHAAALKHVNILEAQAAEAVKTNILGTLNVLEAARSVGVSRFVNVSTDKAADPENVLGYSKRIAEGLTKSYSSGSDGTYISVRFGNVLGTSGSVLKTFAAQIGWGGPVTVTDPEVTRYFMTVQEAVQLVIQAAAIGRDGEALVLDMGEPVRIIDVARQLIDQSGEPIQIVFTGLKPGEKLHEALFGAGEVGERPIHPLVSHVSVPPISNVEAAWLPKGRDNAVNVLAMAEMSLRMRDSLLQKARR